MRFWVTFTAALIIVGCSRVPDAADRYNMVVSTGGSYEDKCRAAREAEGEALRAGDPDQYQMWRIRADVDCALAQLDR